MAYINGKLPFGVVKGPESKIMEKAHNEGVVYFTTDTKKIYLDTATERLAMGGNTGIYYADVKFENSEDLEFFFTIDDIDEGLMPNVKDLILNTDGCFYKVDEIDGDGVIKAIKLTIAGSGGGGGGPSTGLAGIDFEMIYPQKNTTATILAGRPFNIEFTFTAKDEQGESTGSGRYELIINNVLKQSGVAKEGRNSIEVSKLFNIVGNYDVKLKCYGDIGGSVDTSKTRQFSVRTSLFSIAWDHDDFEIHNLSKDFTMNWSISVESSNKKSYITIDDKYGFESTSSSLTISKEELKELGIGHGTHKFDLYTEAYIGDSDTPVYSDHVIKNVMFYDDTAETDPGYIINCKYFETQISQFDTITIPVMIYHPSNSNGTATIQFKVNGANKAPVTNAKNLTYYDFSYTPDESGFMSLQFTCGVAEKSFILDVLPLDMDVEEVSGYAFKFKATEFANNEEIENWTFKDQSGVTRSIYFPEDFDWVNGGLQSGADDVGPYFKIQAGSYMEFPYKMFANDLKDTGASFKIIFKAHNCRDYDASILNCTFGSDQIGLALNAQGSKIKSLSNFLEVRYCEDSYIEYEFDVCKYNGSNVEDQYLTVWMDGVPAGVTQITNADSFKQGEAASLRIGSDDCDVYLYLVKFYKKHLTSDEHLSNFIMDAPNSAEMMRRFNRNDILIKDSRGNSYISPELLAEKNPECNVFIYDIPKIPTSKKDVHYGDNNVKCCSFTHLRGSKDALRSYDGVSVRAQGTSSMTYGISAYNLDAKFPEKWSINETSIPVNYMNTKVNVASCEGANNALNQEWYNKYQPYKCQKRLQARDDGKVARDTMEFINGVVFIQDNNKTSDSKNATDNNVFKEIPGYVENPYPRMYSIGNMGNAKKNTDVFHGAGNQYECCIENADNNTSAQRMLIIGGCIPANGEEGDPDYTEKRDININLSDDMFDERGFLKPEYASVNSKNWGTTYDPQTGINFDNQTLWKEALIGEGWFEFRYCVDEEDFEPTEEFPTFEAYQWELSNRYLRLVRWFAKNNPSLATGEELPAPVTILDYTVKGVEATAYSNYNSEDEVLKGTTVTGGTFTHDTAEYRVAKMLHESEDYLILDSILYHYLFIERHTMVDNVAKNTFWNTEDGIHWELTKDYDNDTADGVDNSGDLKFDYGYEIMDNVGHSENGASVFNARPSAWLHFAHGLLPLREKMYQTLQNRNAWKAQPYLEMFANWQDKIPEICWIEDFNRKYFRPNNVYGDKSYLNRLANGKKTHQRNQYETYQEQYMNSEYKTSAGEGTLIQWRSKQPSSAIKNDNGEYEIRAKVKMYADGYFTAAIASGAGEEAAINIHTRGKKGQEIEFSKAQLTSFDDATCYIYSPNLYQEFTGVEGLYPEYVTAIAANKLRKISIEPKDDVQKLMLKESLSIGTNVEEVIIKDCTEAKFDLDLANYPRLKKLDATGSAFTSFTIADGAPLNYFRVNAPQAISMSNLRYLKKQNEENEESFTIQSYENLRKLIIDNIDYHDVNTKDILNNLNKDNYLEYSLKNVNWTFDENDNITDTSIPLLDYLLTKGSTIGVYEVEDEEGNIIIVPTKVEDSLTGVANIPNEAYSGDNALELYETYGMVSIDDKSYPKLDLIFTDAENDNKLYTVIIKNGDGEVRWKRKYKDFSTISNADLANSSLGSFNVSEAVKKQPSPTEVFTFKNQWKYSIVEGEEIKSTGVIKGEDIEFIYLDLSKLNTLAGNIIIEPDYSSSTRYYTISFLDRDTDALIYSAEAQYDDTFENVAPPSIPAKDDSNLALTQTYRLRGYSAAKESNTIINQEYWRVTEDSKFYPVFEEVSVYDIDYTKYLDITQLQDGGYRLNGLITIPGNNKVTVYQGGKLVIPNYVTKIKDSAFMNIKTIKKVFTNGSTFDTIGKYAFQYSTLEYFDFNNCTISTIDEYAFAGLPLNSTDYNSEIRLSNGLTKICKSAFNGCILTSQTPVTFYIPGSIQEFGGYAIAHIEGAPVYIQIGDQGDPVTKLIFDLTINKIFSTNSSLNEPEDIKQVTIYSDTYHKNSEFGGKNIITILCGDDSANINVEFVKQQS